MKQLTLGYKARDVHELACDAVARHAGLYRKRGLSVLLVDTRPPAGDARPEPPLSAACGAALLRWLEGGSVSVAVVASSRPMFWLYAVDARTLADLRGRSIATWPDAAPPTRFLRVVLGEAGLEIGRDVQLIAARDDDARLGLLRSGRAAAALISSARPPFRLAAGHCRELLCLGDLIRVPTTGLAVTGALAEGDRESVSALCDAFREALHIVHEDRRRLVAALAESGLVDPQDAEGAAGLLRDFYTADGRVSAADIVDVGRVADSLGRPLPSNPAMLYRESLRG